MPILQLALNVDVPILLQLRQRDATTVDMAQPALIASSKRTTPLLHIGLRSGMPTRASSLGTTFQLYDLLMAMV
jgi:hypothetical protein